MIKQRQNWGLHLDGCSQCRPCAIISASVASGRQRPPKNAAAGSSSSIQQGLNCSRRQMAPRQARGASAPACSAICLGAAAVPAAAAAGAGLARHKVLLAGHHLDEVDLVTNLRGRCAIPRMVWVVRRVVGLSTRVSTRLLRRPLPWAPARSVQPPPPPARRPTRTFMSPSESWPWVT